MLRKLEDALRAALEAPFAQLFPDKLHPVEMAAAVRQAMDRSRLLEADYAYVHNRYTIRLNLQDHARLSGAIPSLERELSDHLLQYAASEGLIAGSHLQVRVEPDTGLNEGQMRVESAFGAPVLAHLEVVGGLPQRGHAHELTGNVTLGRGADCDVRLDEPAVSRQHAEIVWQYVLYQIRDLDSANGTFVNGQQVLRAPLSDGDLIELGLTKLRFRSR